MSLTTTALVMQNLKVRSQDPDLIAWYDLLRREAEAGIKQYCKWSLEYVADQVDYYSGGGQVAIPLRRPYVTAVTEVVMDQQGAWGQHNGSFSSTPLTLGVDYALQLDADSGGKSGLLVRLSSNVGYLFPSDLFYYRNAGGLSYTSYTYWPAGQGNIKVTYNYGFATIPEEIQLAVASAVGALRNTVKYGAMASSESLGAHSISLSIGKEAQFGEVKQLLGTYRDLNL